jgi:AcrR family transcriptional regulator
MSQPAEPLGGPRSRKGEQTRARLLHAAKGIFEEQGFLEARISDIAERAGLSHGAFYHYFESKEQIFREIAVLLDEELSEPMETVIFAPATGRDSRGAPARLDPRRRLYTANHRHLERYRDEARIMGVIEQVARYDAQVAAVRATRSRLHREQIEASIRGLQRRKLADRTLDPTIAAAALAAMVERLAEMWLAQGQVAFDLDAAAGTVATLFANALDLRTPPGPTPK